jgi:hypothetical protein
MLLYSTSIKIRHRHVLLEADIKYSEQYIGVLKRFSHQVVRKKVYYTFPFSQIVSAYKGE